MAMERLRHAVLAASSEDPDFPAASLAEQGPQTRGWQSARQCALPQELVLGLDTPCRLQQIQLLSHEYKITSKIELSVGSLPPGGRDLHGAVWRKLGSISFDTNERSSYHARELKSVHIDAEARLLRLTLHQPHPNRYNSDGQVALVAVNIHGIPGAPLAARPLPQEPQELPRRPAAEPAPAQQPAATPALSRAPSSSTAGVDAATAERIGELARRKAAAVDEEDYDAAKALKQEIDCLRALGGRILELERRKRVAIEEEDYDTAKAIKADIAKARAGGGAAAVDGVAIRGDAGGAGLAETPVPAAEAFYVPASGQGSRVSAEALDHASAQLPAFRPRATQDGEPGPAPEGSAREPPEPEAALGEPPEGWPPGLPQPEALSAADAKEADDVGQLLGPFTAAALYSRSWQLREAALQRLEAFLGAQDAEKQRLALPAATRAIQRAARERVPNVFQAGMQVLARLVACSSAGGAPRDAASLTADVLPTLLEKIGDSNARIQAAASDALLQLARVPEAGLLSLAAAFLQPQRQTVWRLVLAKLQLLTQLVPVWGVARGGGGGGGGDGLQLEPLMSFVGAAFANANADVRSAAVALTSQVAAAVGSAAVDKLLPRDLNPKIREQLAGASPAARPASPPLPAAAARRRSSGGSAPAAGRPPAGDRRRSNGGAAAPARQPPERRGSSRAAQREAVPAQPRQYAPATTTVQLHELAAEACEEDPGPYQQELLTREQLLGPDHPDVAVSLSNLAILHNQRGEFGLAAPLYERALGIFERHHGPDAPAVAHTLTDLAVLHLEQGDTEAGRPLLERALAIQQQALGPDHPDVVAIRDVLEDGSDVEL